MHLPLNYLWGPIAPPIGSMGGPLLMTLLVCPHAVRQLSLANDRYYYTFPPKVLGCFLGYLVGSIYLVLIIFIKLFINFLNYARPN